MKWKTEKKVSWFGEVLIRGNNRWKSEKGHINGKVSLQEKKVSQVILKEQEVKKAINSFIKLIAKITIS